MQAHEHKFLADFQPLVGFGPAGSYFRLFTGAALNWAALFGAAYVIGAGLKAGLGM